MPKFMSRLIITGAQNAADVAARYKRRSVVNSCRLPSLATDLYTFSQTTVREFEIIREAAMSLCRVLLDLISVASRYSMFHAREGKRNNYRQPALEVAPTTVPQETRHSQKMPA